MTEHAASAACYRKGCRRAECRRERRLHEKRLELRRLRGDDSRVDAEPARKTLKALVEQGVTLATLGRWCGVTRFRIWQVINGSRDSHGPPRRIDRTLADRILDLESKQLVIGRGVPAIGSQRRLQAFLWQGRPVHSLIREIGIGKTTIAQVLSGYPRVTLVVHLKIKRYYDSHGAKYVGDERTLNRAARERLYGPGAWDANTIDDPDALPDKGALTRKLTR